MSLSKSKAPAIGIDLGTTNSCVAVWRNGRVEVIANDQGKRITPSCVAFNDEERFLGDPALVQRMKNPKNTVYDVKRLMGRRFEDREVQEDMNRWPFTVVDVGGKPRIQVEYKEETKRFAPEQISAMVLRKMKEIADKYLDCDVKDAVITVPAYFNNAQRQATIDAGKIAGLNVLRIINEPTAAALAYALNAPLENKKNFLIYDLGGGTFDVSIVRMERGRKIQVLATAGDTHLGGGDFDGLLFKYLAEKFKKDEDKDVYVNVRAKCRLNKASEEAKMALSFALQTDIVLESLMGVDFFPTFTRAKFEEICYDLFNSTLSHVKKALDDAKLTKDDIDDVVLVGGSSRIPMVKQLLLDFFPGKGLKESINADEAVAYGAAVQAAMLTRVTGWDIQDLDFTDITSLSLGLEDFHLKTVVAIPRHTCIPCHKISGCVTNYENQDKIQFSVYEGENKIAKENNFLGSFTLRGISPGPAGEEKAQVYFHLDYNGVLNVTAVEKTTAKTASILINMKEACLTEDELQRAIDEVAN